MTPVQSQIESAAVAVAELLHIGCRVISVRCSSMLDRARVHIDDPGTLLDHLDNQSCDGSTIRYWEMGVLYRDCAVFWLLPRPQSELALQALREGFPS